MSQTSSILRQLLIIRKIRVANQSMIYPSIEDLIKYVEDEFSKRDLPQKAGASEPTLKRDFKQIREYFRIPIVYDNKERGYFIEEEDFSFVESTLESFEILSAISADGLMPKHIIPEKRKIATGLQHFGYINRCIEDKVSVTFKYHKYDTDNRTYPVVKPLFLKESRGRWYVLAQPENETEIKAYALDRISNLEGTGQKFKLKVSETEINQKYADCFAMFTSNELVQKVVLSFDRRDGNYLKTYPIHHSQTIIENEKEVLITLQIKITLDFIMELMSRAWSVKVLEPLSLKAELHRIFNDAANRNV